MMEKFKTFTGIVAPLDRSNVDTDAIIPKQFLKSIKRSGFGPNLFDDWRYLDAVVLHRRYIPRQKLTYFWVESLPFAVHPMKEWQRCPPETCDGLRWM